MIIVEWWCCFLLSSKSVWFEDMFLRFVGFIRLLVLLMGWLFMFNEGIIMFNIESMFEFFCELRVLELIIFKGIGELIVFWGELWVLMIVIFLSLLFFLFVFFLVFCVCVFFVINDEWEWIFIVLFLLVIIVNFVFLRSCVSVLFSVNVFFNVFVFIFFVKLKGKSNVVFVCLVSLVSVLLVFCVGIEKL